MALVAPAHTRPTLPHTHTSHTCVDLLRVQGGGLHTCFQLISAWHGSVTLSMLRLMATLAHGNTYVRNMSRQAGFLPLLLSVVRGCASSHPETAVSVTMDGLGGV